jgi:queuine tRNA-ribosyltransferase
MPAGFSFELLAQDKHTAARRGRITTPRGTVELPAFMPVGTRGAVRCMKPDEIRRTGAEILLANTYHLHLKPGENLIEKAGGLHAFMGWERPILTDSGGFQVFSLPKR